MLHHAAALLLALAACQQAPATSTQADTSFPALAGRVVDQADLLTPAQEARLTQLSERIEREVGPQFVVTTVPTLQGQAIEDFAKRLGKHWGVGNKDRNDGVLLVVAPNERKVRIAIGKGLETTVADADAKRIIDNDILPKFRAGDMAGGIIHGSEGIDTMLRERIVEPLKEAA